jgi:hypothetical protein
VGQLQEDDSASPRYKKENMFLHLPSCVTINGSSRGQEIQRSCVILSDAAACMLKMAETLKAFYLRLVHVVLCLAYQPSTFLDIFQKGIILYQAQRRCL